MKTNVKKNVGKVGRAVGWMVLGILMLVLGAKMQTKKVEAAAGYVKMFDYETEEGTAVKHGKYYFKYEMDRDRSNMLVYSSDKKNGTYELTPMSSYATYTNGKQAYYIKSNENVSPRTYILYKYSFQSKKETEVKKLPVEDEVRWSLGIVYGNKIYFTKIDFSKFKLSVYSYDIKEKKLLKERKNASISGNSSKYILSFDNYVGDPSPIKISLLKITSSGLKKVKTLAKKGSNAEMIKNKIYYAEYKYGEDEYRPEKLVLYQCKADGSDKKKLATFQAPKMEYGLGEIWLGWIGTESCIVYSSKNNIDRKSVV